MQGRGGGGSSEEAGAALQAAQPFRQPVAPQQPSAARAFPSLCPPPCHPSLTSLHPSPLPPHPHMQAVDRVTPLVPEDCVPFVGEALRRLRAEVGGASTVLGFVGAPFTLATYIVEGALSSREGGRGEEREGGREGGHKVLGRALPAPAPAQGGRAAWRSSALSPIPSPPRPSPSHHTQIPPPPAAGGMSKNYVQIKKLMFTEPEVLHALLQKLADAVVTYIKYQVGAQAGAGAGWGWCRLGLPRGWFGAGLGAGVGAGPGGALFWRPASPPPRICTPGHPLPSFPLPSPCCLSARSTTTARRWCRSSTPGRRS